MSTPYRGRLAPTPTGHLHLGHAATFRCAHDRARAVGGALIYREEDLDPQRCRPQYADAAREDLQWLGLTWDGQPIRQSDRRAFYLAAWRTLRATGHIYPCARSRRDIASASVAPHEEEPIFPVEWRSPDTWPHDTPAGINWRFRVPEETLVFHDENLGRVEKVGQRDFGDFLVWNRDDIPAYELAVVVDDIAMQITEVVRGEDLLTSTARQLLIYRALGATAPTFFHCPLLCDESGQRLAKRHASLSLRTLRAEGWQPTDIWRAVSESRTARRPLSES